jgi:hypothetical protein
MEQPIKVLRGAMRVSFQVLLLAVVAVARVLLV